MCLLLFHPNGRFAFLVLELGNLVSSLSWSPADGFHTLDTLSTLSDEKYIISHAETQRGGDRRDDFITGALPQPPENLCDLGLPASSASLRLCVKSDPNHIAAAIRFTPDMKRIVVSNRGENSLAVYDFDSETGRLAFKSRTFLAGSWPRDFTFVSDGLALVALERSGEVHMLRYDAATGDFETVATVGGLFRPVALRASGSLLVAL